MKPQDNENSLASGNTLHDPTIETSSKPHDPRTRRPRQSGSKERKQCVRQSRRKNTAEMSKSESTIEEKDYSQTCTMSPSTSIASTIEIEDIEQLHQLSQPTGSQPSQKSFSICSILSQLSESLKDLQPRMVHIETHLAIVRDGMEKMQATIDEIKGVMSQTGLIWMVGSETEGEFARIRPGLNP